MQNPKELFQYDEQKFKCTDFFNCYLEVFSINLVLFMNIQLNMINVINIFLDLISAAS